MNPEFLSRASFFFFFFSSLPTETALPPLHNYVITSKANSLPLLWGQSSSSILQITRLRWYLLPAKDAHSPLQSFICSPFVTWIFVNNPNRVQEALTTILYSHLFCRMKHLPSRGIQHLHSLFTTPVNKGYREGHTTFCSLSISNPQQSRIPVP